MEIAVDKGYSRSYRHGNAVYLLLKSSDSMCHL